MKARYVKIIVDAVYSEYAWPGIGVDELQALTADGTNAALNKGVTASSYQNVGWGPYHLTDGGITTSAGIGGWLTGGQTGEWAVIDLGSDFDIKTIKVNSIGNWPGAQPTPLKDYRVFLSEDGTSYTLVKTITSGANTVGRVDSFDIVNSDSQLRSQIATGGA